MRTRARIPGLSSAPSGRRPTTMSPRAILDRHRDVRSDLGSSDHAIPSGEVQIAGTTRRSAPRLQPSGDEARASGDDGSRRSTTECRPVAASGDPSGRRRSTSRTPTPRSSCRRRAGPSAIGTRRRSPRRPHEGRGRGAVLHARSRGAASVVRLGGGLGSTLRSRSGRCRG